MDQEVADDTREGSVSDAARDVDVHLEGVSKHFGDVQALRPTTLSISRGEFFSLLGASGSGKTTTLRIIAGFEEPTNGRVFLRGRDVTGCAPYERNVNTVFQDYALFPHMNVEDNIGYGLRVRHVDRKEIRRRVHEALELVRLPGFEKRRPSQLSGGQRQRVALARALVNAPSVLLLDEPLGALDLKLRREMQFELKRIQKDVGITFLYVTHDQEEAMSMSDRVAVMSEGQIMQVGTPTDVYEHPTNAFVAGFVGVSNILECLVEQHDGSTLTVIGPGAIRLRVPAHVDIAPGQTVLVTVRPEKIRLLRAQLDSVSQSNVVSGTIIDVSYAGAFTRYTVRAQELEMAVVAQNEGAGPSAHVGEEVWLSWPVQQSYLLSGSGDDVQRGQREAIPVEH